MNRTETTQSQTTPQEYPFFIAPEEARIFAVCHKPVGNSLPDRNTCVIFCDPFAEEAAITQKITVDFARLLAIRGYQVIRFNYRGTGDSSGLFQDCTINTYLDDIDRVRHDFLKQSDSRIVLFGVRLGATLAAMAAAMTPEVHALIMWEPIADLKIYINNFIRMQVMSSNVLAARIVESREKIIERLSAGETVDILGYPLTTAHYQSFLNSDTDELRRTGSPALIAGIGGSAARKDLLALQKTMKTGSNDIRIIRTNNKIFWIDPGNAFRELGFWYGHDQLFNQSADWLDHTLA